MPPHFEGDGLDPYSCDDSVRAEEDYSMLESLNFFADMDNERTISLDSRPRTIYPDNEGKDIAAAHLHRDDDHEKNVFFCGAVVVDPQSSSEASSRKRKRNQPDSPDVKMGGQRTVLQGICVNALYEGNSGTCTTMDVDTSTVSQHNAQTSNDDDSMPPRHCGRAHNLPKFHKIYEVIHRIEGSDHTGTQSFLAQVERRRSDYLMGNPARQETIVKELRDWARNRGCHFSALIPEHWSEMDDTVAGNMIRSLLENVELFIEASDAFAGVVTFSRQVQSRRQNGDYFLCDRRTRKVIVEELIRIQLEEYEGRYFFAVDSGRLVQMNHEESYRVVQRLLVENDVIRGDEGAHHPSTQSFRAEVQSRRDAFFQGNAETQLTIVNQLIESVRTRGNCFLKMGSKGLVKMNERDTKCMVQSLLTENDVIYCRGVTNACTESFRKQVQRRAVEYFHGNEEKQLGEIQLRIVQELIEWVKTQGVCLLQFVKVEGRWAILNDEKDVNEKIRQSLRDSHTKLQSQGQCGTCQKNKNKC